ncbi:pectinesterase family protein [Gallaecimonas pentaromativorans]|uniref:Pectinesterase n=1 Tax=Gallaecimonas pentaromativorans TaxID=584787 RepID=A0A3N1P3N2_9GAMM|nr:pectinesterase family protein [Gallaecimonas pentaromativorans]ROQ22689.1 pectinesterase [Gallaecimonas pentaromativorans]
MRVLLSWLVLFCGGALATPYQAVVGPGGDHATIAAALAAVPADNPKPFTIFIKDGVYREKLSIDKPHVQLLGQSQGGTIIRYGDSAEAKGPDGKAVGTWGSYVLRVTAPDFTAQNLTIDNSFDFPANAAKSDTDPSKVRHTQAVALATAGQSDRALFRHVTLLGYQDTLLVDAGRQLFEDCTIKGNVDFIFGKGQAVFRRCDIVSRNREGAKITGYITAPSTDISQPYGFLFIHNRFLKEPGVPKGSVRLGRPWHPSGDPRAEGSAVFIDNFMDDHFGKEGYAAIGITRPDGTPGRFEVHPWSRFFEYANTGPGAIKSDERPQLLPRALPWYNADAVLAGWQPN